MTSRPGVVTNARVPADGGASPSRVIPAVTAEVRCFWPPLATDEQIEDALTQALDQAREQIKEKRR